jgi:hypothetical protein
MIGFAVERRKIRGGSIRGAHDEVFLRDDSVISFVLFSFSIRFWTLAKENGRLIQFCTKIRANQWLQTPYTY